MYVRVVVKGGEDRIVPESMRNSEMSTMSRLRELLAPSNIVTLGISHSDQGEMLHWNAIESGRPAGVHDGYSVQLVNGD